MNTRRTERPEEVAKTSIRTRGGSLAPGGVVGDGRYRLLAQLGVDERAGAHLWRARDGQLRRDVALTLVVGDPADLAAARRARRTLERAAHAAQFNHAYLARVLDVLSLGNGIAAGEGLLGIVVSEWSKGTDVIDVVDGGPVSPGVACRMVEPLVDAVERAHHSGLVLGLDHPQRIRRGLDGSLRLAFPGPLPDATLRDDIKALGAILYLLLTGRWPLDGGPAAIPAAPHGPNGRVVPPKSLEPHVPAELSALAARTLSDGGEGGIRTSAAFLRVLRQVADAEERTALIKRGALEDDDFGGPDDDAIWTTKKPVTDAATRKKVAVGATILVVAAVGIMAWIGLSLISFFQTDPDSAAGPDLNVAESNEKEEPPTKTKEKPAAPTGEAVEPTAIRVYNPEGTGDFDALAPMAIDGDPASPWTTDLYKQQLPALKSGVGLSTDFEQPINLTKVKILGASPGTKVEVRVSDHPNPHLPDSRVVAGPTELTGSETELTLDEPVNAAHVIIWVTQLSDAEGQFQSSIGELRFFSATQP